MSVSLSDQGVFLVRATPLKTCTETKIYETV